MALPRDGQMVSRTADSTGSLREGEQTQTDPPKAPMLIEPQGDPTTASTAVLGASGSFALALPPWPC